MSEIPGAVIIEGHVQGLSNLRSLGEKGIPTIVVDKSNCIARYSKYCQSFRICPDFAEDDFATFLIELAKLEDLKNWVLIPSNDHAVHTIAIFKSELEAYYKVITPGIDTIENIYDKAKLIELADRIKVPTPNTLRNNPNTSPDPFKNFPALVKGCNGLSFYKAFGKKAFLVNDKQELIRTLNEIASTIDLSATITQELIPIDEHNKTISFTAFVDKGEMKTYWMGEKIREHPIHFGTATFCQSVSIDSLLEPSMRLMEEIQYTGVCEIEYLLDPRDNQYKLIEINPRTWLWVGLAKACGVDYAKIIYNYFHGENDYPKPTDLEHNLSWSNYATDFFFSCKSILKRKISPRNILLSYRGQVIRAVHNRTDFLPGIMYLVLLFKFVRNR